MFKRLKLILILMAMILLFGMLSIAEAAPQWQATVWVASGGGNLRLVLGGDDTATDGFDNVWDSYAMLGGQLRPYFYRPDWHPVFKNYWRDIRAKAPGNTTEWPFVIESDMYNKDVTLTWDLSLAPKNYTLSIIDETTGRVIDMRSSPSYKFLYTAARNFRVAVYEPPEIVLPKNRVPVANAGADSTVECRGSYGANIILDGSGSSDPDGDDLIYTWTGTFGTVTGVNPQVQIPLGTHTVTLAVDDGKGGTSNDTVLITVRDITPPSTTATITGADGNNNWYVSGVAVGLKAADSCSGVKAINYSVDGLNSNASGDSASVSLGSDGRHTITYYATDSSNNSESQLSLSINIDKTPPAVNVSATPDILWPPNKKMVNVTINGSAQDATSGIALVNITVTDEYGGYNMTVPGFGSVIQLEAWREGTDKDGRRYTIKAVATDMGGNQTYGTAEVVVPLNMGR